MGLEARGLLVRHGCWSRDWSGKDPICADKQLLRQLELLYEPEKGLAVMRQGLVLPRMEPSALILGRVAPG